MNVKVHSVIDVITNSSTEIYTFMDGCVGPVKELINEFSFLLGHDVQAEDMFEIIVLPECSSYITDAIEYDSGVEIMEKAGVEYEEAERIIDKAYRGELDSIPEWLQKLNERVCEDREYGPSTTLFFLLKDDKYRGLADSIKRLLVSVEQIEGVG